ncbi:MAG: hypothetical protein M3Z20_12765 [Chloroflexota bacterium]|nr:hypothetical protein [Chloroflexota bacterium]
MHNDLPGRLTVPLKAISRRVLNRQVATALAIGLPAALPAAGKKKGKGKNKQKKKCRKMGGTLFKGACCKGSPRACVARCAFPTVQGAIMGAKAGATITVCPGTYREDLAIAADVRLVGAGADSTILQGSGTLSVVRNFSQRVTLEHLRITGGAAAYGAGIDNSGDMTLNTCTVTGNHALIGGGGIRNAVNTQSPNGGKLRLTNCTVNGNRVGTEEDGGGGGGGISNVLGAVTLTNTVISDNVTGPGVSGPPDDPVVIEFPSVGGGIKNDGGSVTLIGSQVRGNRGDYGGGIRNDGGVVTLDAASRVTGNTANDDEGGGGIDNSDGTVTLATSANVTGNTPSNCAGDAVPLCAG